MDYHYKSIVDKILFIGYYTVNILCYCRTVSYTHLYKAMDNECKVISNNAAEFAEMSEEPGLETLYEDVLA